MTTTVIEASTITVSRRQIEAEQRDKRERAEGQQLFAAIKKSSQYYGQTTKGELFPVFIMASHSYGYHVQGGPGGQYRLSDVNLYVVEDGHTLRIS